MNSPETPETQLEQQDIAARSAIHDVDSVSWVSLRTLSPYEDKKSVLFQAGRMESCS